MITKKIIIILTCHNRKDLTVASLAEIYNQKLSSNYNIEVLLVDDGSTDGTSDAIKKDFPQVDVLQGNGSLFWNGGMRKAFGKAIQREADYYLWMNDDTILYDNAFDILMPAIDQMNDDKFILVGSTQDSKTKKHTYGGERQKHKMHPFKLELVTPHPTKLQKCDTMNGNFVLIPHAVTLILGNLDSHYTHAFGDTDYGFRAQKKNIPIFVLPNYIGTCSENSLENTWQDESLPFKERLEKRHSIKGLPFSQWLYFCQQHGGILKYLFVFSPYLKMFLQSLIRNSR